MRERVEITEKEYRTLPGAGTAQILNALARDRFLLTAQIKGSKGQPLIAELKYDLKEPGDLWYEIKVPVFVEGPTQ